MPKSAVANSFYNLIVRRNQTFLGVIFLTAFGLEMGMDTGANKIWDYINRGRQWKDIKHRYMEASEDE